MAGTLFVVATPIGNLGDITYRAVQILNQVNLIACEDTRHTHKLLHHYGIKTTTISYHEHNEQQRTQELLELMRNGSDVALVSDAGTPTVSDPGFRIVQAAGESGIPVIPIPGPSAVITALAVAGLPTDEFLFVGFLPSKAAARQNKLKQLVSVQATLICYEAPHRLAATLKDAASILGDRRAVVARELTKLHEQIKRGQLTELAQHYGAEETPRGEIVVLIDRNPIEPAITSIQSSVSEVVARLETEGMDHRLALKRAARELGLSRAEAYRQMLSERKKD
ncbi:MAG TPA: 16S rRNA (cytidine(1402)-2'-O)-methyltransferase [Pyrinomonadaceae bacterium]|nr:16S rRNA (cytidine(1402)-2'-O)-methyltransferase [Pyrinomonadaceae bacterium]